MKSVFTFILLGILAVSAQAALPEGMTPVSCGDHNKVFYPTPKADGIQSVCLSELRSDAEPFRSFHKYLFVNVPKPAGLVTYVVDFDFEGNQKAVGAPDMDHCLGKVNHDTMHSRLSICEFEASPSGVIENGIFRPLPFPKFSNGQWAPEFNVQVTTIFMRTGEIKQQVNMSDWYDAGGPRGYFWADLSPDGRLP